MKNTITAYTFNAAAKTIDLSGIAGFDIKRLLAVLNSTTGAVIYAVAQQGLGFSNITGSVVTFQKDTTEMSNGDKLVVLYDLPNEQSVLSVDSGPRKATALITDTALTNCRGINVSTAGTVKVDMIDGGTGVLLYVVQGMNAMHITKIYSTGGTATVQALLY